MTAPARVGARYEGMNMCDRKEAGRADQSEARPVNARQQATAAELFDLTAGQAAEFCAGIGAASNAAIEGGCDEH